MERWRRSSIVIFSAQKKKNKSNKNLKFSTEEEEEIHKVTRSSDSSKSPLGSRRVFSPSSLRHPGCGGGSVTSS